MLNVCGRPLDLPGRDLGRGGGESRRPTRPVIFTMHCLTTVFELRRVVLPITRESSNIVGRNGRSWSIPPDFRISATVCMMHRICVEDEYQLGWLS